MSRVVERLAGSVWSLLALADRNFVAYQDRQRQRMHAIDAAQAQRAARNEALARLDEAIQTAHRRTVARRSFGIAPMSLLIPPRAKTVLASNMPDGLLSK